jgi:hypothetical protein
MSDFVLTSIIASVVLTVVVNLMPRFFPGASRKAERKLVETVQSAEERDARGEGPRVRVFFPWKIMLIASIVLTVLVNLAGLIVR